MLKQNYTMNSRAESQSKVLSSRHASQTPDPSKAVLAGPPQKIDLIPAVIGSGSLGAGANVTHSLFNQIKRSKLSSQYNARDHQFNMGSLQAPLTRLNQLESQTSPNQKRNMIANAMSVQTTAGNYQTTSDQIFTNYTTGGNITSGQSNTKTQSRTGRNSAMIVGRSSGSARKSTGGMKTVLPVRIKDRHAPVQITNDKPAEKLHQELIDRRSPTIVTQPSATALTDKNQPVKEVPSKEMLAAMGYHSPVGYDYGWSLSRLEGLKNKSMNRSDSMNGNHRSGSHMCQKHTNKEPLVRPMSSIDPVENRHQYQYSFNHHQHLAAVNHAINHNIHLQDQQLMNETPHKSGAKLIHDQEPLVQSARQMQNRSPHIQHRPSSVKAGKHSQPRMAKNQAQLAVANFGNKFNYQDQGNYIKLQCAVDQCAQKFDLLNRLLANKRKVQVVKMANAKETLAQPLIEQTHMCEVAVGRGESIAQTEESNQRNQQQPSSISPSPSPTETGAMRLTPWQLLNPGANGVVVGGMTSSQMETQKMSHDTSLQRSYQPHVCHLHQTVYQGNPVEWMRESV